MIKCPICNKKTMESSSHYYTRAHNHLCDQSAGALGRWCTTCSDIVWDEPDYAKWILEQPLWVGDPRDMSLKAKYNPDYAYVENM